jgi:CubicO group peptidase (beta-lactamase class C family)
VTNVFQGYVDEGRLPGAVLLIVRDGKVGYLRAFGYQDREKKIAMRPDSVFRIASMTKPIVSVAAMMLVEEGKLDLANFWIARGKECL